MSPTIVLNRNTTNPNIPVIPIPGFTDDFNRTDAAALGSTPGGKPWSISGGTWSIKSNMAAYNGSNSYSYATVDGLTTDGTLTAKVSALTAEGGANMGLTFRYTDADNYIRVYFRNGGENRAAILHRKNGVDTNTWVVPGSKEVAVNSTVSITGIGSALTVKVDGVTVVTATTPLLTGTRHGLVGVANGLDVRFDSVSFVPA